MQQVKLFNFLLWGFNVLLGAGITLFAVVFLLIQRPLENVDPGEEEEGTGPPPRPPLDFALLRGLPNPVVKGMMDTGRSTVVGDFNPEYLGGWGDTVFIKLGGKDTLAEVQKPIAYVNDQGDEVVIGGWQLISFDENTATFSDGARQHVARRKEEGGGGEIGGATSGRRRTDQAGKEYDPNKYTTRLRPGSAEAGRPVYEVDPEEAAWAQQNADAVLANDVQLSVYGGGGLQVTSVNPGSIAEARGIKGQDVIRSVNGAQVMGLADLKKIQTQMAASKTTTMTLELERAGRIVYIEYRTVKPGR